MSGYRDPGSTGRHLPLLETKQASMLEVLDTTLHTILEIDECPAEILATEYRYVLGYGM